jgi:hypothetical protein
MIYIVYIYIYIYRERERGRFVIFVTTNMYQQICITRKPKDLT